MARISAQEIARKEIKMASREFDGATRSLSCKVYELKAGGVEKKI